MRKLSSLLMGLVAGGSILAGSLAGGVASADERVRVVPRREVVREPSREVEVIRRYPDRAPPEIPREAEGRWRGHVWVGGGYDWIHGRYIYVPGHYVAERPGYRWENARWERRGHHYFRVPGHWVR